jgi:hypothetical protein
MVGTQNILQPSQSAPEDCKLAHPHTKSQRTLNFDQTVRDRIESLLARCDQLRRGSDLRHVTFDERGEREARAVAERDRAWVEC